MPTEKAIRRLLSLSLHLLLNVLSGHEIVCIFQDENKMCPTCLRVRVWVRAREWQPASPVGLFILVHYQFIYFYWKFIRFAVRAAAEHRAGRPQCMQKPIEHLVTSLATRNNNQEINLTHTRTTHKFQTYSFTRFRLQHAFDVARGLSNPVSAMSTTHIHHWGWCPSCPTQFCISSNAFI